MTVTQYLASSLVYFIIYWQFVFLAWYAWFVVKSLKDEWQRK